MKNLFVRKVGLFSLLIFGLFLFVTPAFGATIYSNYSTGNDTTGDGSFGNPYKTFHKAYTVASALDTIMLSGTFNWANADETGDSSSTGYTLGKELTIIGESATSTIIQAASTAGSAGKRVFTISANASTTIKNVMIRYGSGVAGAGVSISAGATTTITNVDFNNNITSNSVNGGAILVTNAEAYISNASIHDNGAGFYGGGIYVDSTGKNVTITNSTIYFNYSQWLSNAIDGGGIYINLGTTTITNSSIVRNGNNSANTARQTTNGGGIVVANSTNAGLRIKNSIVAHNTAGTAPNIYKYTSGIIVNSGYNVVGKSSNYTATTGDWIDSTDSGTFTLNTVGTTGTLGLALDGALNDTTNGTKTFYLSSSSVAVNNAENTVHNGVSIPTLDQRGATRSGATDIGAFEVNGGGTWVSVPTTQSSNITFSSVEYNAMNISWVNGNGSRRVVFMKEGSSGNPAPADGTVYSASTVFGSGDQIGSSGWYTIYNSIATSSSSTTTVTGLTRNTDYIVQVVEYNGVGDSNSVYLTSTATGNPATQTSHDPVTIYSDYTSGNDTTGDGSSGTPYKTFHKAYTTAKHLDTIQLSGTFNWANADETGDAAGSGYTLAKELTIIGQTATSTIIQAASTASTTAKRVFTIAANASTTIKNVMIRHGYNNDGAGVYIGANATTTITNVDLNNNWTTTSGNGGAINNAGADLYISNSSIHDNAAGFYGGGLYVSASGKSTTVTNSTFYYNFSQWLSNAIDGGGIYINLGTTTITNSTIIKNGNNAAGTARQTTNGGGIIVGNSTNAGLRIKNSIVAQNTAGTAPNIYKYSSGIIVNSGYNVVGKSTSYTATTGDWIDSTDSGTFTLNTVGTTGALNLASASSLNSNPLGTYTWGVTSGSIIIDTANGTAHNGTTIPTLDQRGATRSGTTDIGAFEYGGGGLLDVSAPTASTTAPASGAVVSGTAVTLSADASDDVSVAGVKFYVNNVLIGSEDISSPYAITWDSTATSSGAKSLVAVARDSSNNYATSSAVSFTLDNSGATVSVTAPTASAYVAGATVTLSADATDDVGVSGVKFYINNVLIGSEDTSAPYSLVWDSTATSSGAKSIVAVARDSSNNQATSSAVSFIVDNNVPIISSISSGTPSSSGATITWTTDENSDTQINYGTTSTYTASTTLSASLVTSHSQAITGLLASTVYHFRVRSTDAAGNLTVSSDQTFTTSSGDSTPPTINLTLPGNGVSISGSAIGMAATASDDTGVVGVKFYVNGHLIGSEDTSSPYTQTWNSVATTSGSRTVFAVARDAAGNHATSSSATVTLNNYPTPTSLSVSTATTSATISWQTPLAGSSKMYFGLVSAIGSSTPKTNASSRVTDHSVDISGLPGCTSYKYVTVSENEAEEVATSSTSTFNTSGCSGGASIVSNSQSTITAAGGGTLTEGALTLTIPTAFTSTSSSATFQANKLDGSTFFSSIAPPTGKNRVGTTVFNLKALTDETTTLTTFSEPLSVTLSYDDADVSGLDESTLKIQRYDDSEWNQLESCSVDTSANTITCTTTHFSDFAIFGDTATVSTGSSGGGRRPVFSQAVSTPLYTTSPTTSVSPIDTSSKPSFFERDLSGGVMGDDVRSLQIFLNTRGFYVALAGPGSLGKETTTFGFGTQRALKEFQIANNISPAYGNFGPATRDLINKLLININKTPTATVENKNKILTFTRDLYIGMSGDDVLELQGYLIEQDSGPYARALIATKGLGYFGPATREAVREFQRAKIISPVSGNLGPITREYIER